MLRIISGFQQNIIPSLLLIYSEALSQGRFSSREDLVEDIYQSMKREGSLLFFWETEDCLVSCVQCELCDDGALLHSLETRPEVRRCGFSKQLLTAVTKHLKTMNVVRITTHVHKRNLVSYKLHLDSGFFVEKDTARLLDGTISTDYYTLVYK